MAKDISKLGIIHVKNSTSKSYKFAKSGTKGNSCIFFDKDKLNCKCKNSNNYHKLCKLCSCYTDKNNKGLRNHKTKCLHYDKSKSICKLFIDCVGSSKCDRYTYKGF